MKTITLAEMEQYLGEPKDESAFIRPASEYTEDVIERIHNPQAMHGAKLPWGKAEFAIQFRPGEVSLWAGINGHGKSMMLGQNIIGFMAQGERCGILSFEMKPVATLARMARQASMGANPSVSFLHDFGKWTDDKLWMYDQQGTVKGHRVLQCSKYMADHLKINHVVIDSLMKCGYNEDDYNGQKDFVDQLCALAKDYNTHVHLVLHIRKQNNEETIPGKMDFKGSGAISDQADNSLIVWRNKKKEDQVSSGKGDKNEWDAILKVDKQRHGEWEGKVGLWFDRNSMQYIAAPDASPIDLMNWK